MTKENKIAQEIFETLRKYANLTPDAIDDLHYLQGYISNLEEKNKEMLTKWLKLNQLVDKAIEYIKENCIDDEFYINLTNKEKHIFIALNILEGSDKR